MLRSVYFPQCFPPEARTLTDYFTANTPLHWANSARLKHEREVYQQHTLCQQIGYAAVGALIFSPKIAGYCIIVTRMFRWVDRVPVIGDFKRGLRNSLIKRWDRILKLSKMSLFLNLVIIAPIWEELVFRGVIHNLSKKITDAPDKQIAFSHSAFALGHVGNVCRIGLFNSHCSVLYNHTDSLAACMTAHAINNFMAFMLICLRKKC